MTSRLKPHPQNVDGPFYVENGCCTACGVPQHFAPELFAEDEEHHCFVRRQPQTVAETDAMIRVVATQELGCIRYRGADRETQRRLIEAGEGSQCDAPLPIGIEPLQRDHVSFLAADLLEPLSGRAVLERLVSYLAKQPQGYKATAITVDEGEAKTSLSVSWFEDRFHRVELHAAPSRGSWILRHSGPPRFSDTLHDWLNGDETFADVRWYARGKGEAAGSWQRTPW